MTPSVMLMLNLEEVLRENFSLNYQESQNKRPDPATSGSLPEGSTKPSKLRRCSVESPYLLHLALTIRYCSQKNGMVNSRVSKANNKIR